MVSFCLPSTVGGIFPLYPSLPLWAVLVHKFMSSFHADDFQISTTLPPSIRMGISSCSICLGIICCQHELNMVKRDVNVFSAPRWQHFSWLLFTQSCYYVLLSLHPQVCLSCRVWVRGSVCLCKVREIKLFLPLFLLIFLAHILPTTAFFTLKKCIVASWRVATIVFFTLGSHQHSLCIFSERALLESSSHRQLCILKFLFIPHLPGTGWFLAPAGPPCNLYSLTYCIFRCCYGCVTPQAWRKIPVNIYLHVSPSNTSFSMSTHPVC